MKLKVLGLAELIGITNTAKAMDYVTAISKEMKNEKAFKKFKDPQLVFIKKEDSGEFIFSVVSRNALSCLFRIIQNDGEYELGCTKPEEDMKTSMATEMKKLVLMSNDDLFEFEV